MPATHPESLPDRLGPKPHASGLGATIHPSILNAFFMRPFSSALPTMLIKLVFSPDCVRVYFACRNTGHIRAFPILAMHGKSVPTCKYSTSGPTLCCSQAWFLGLSYPPPGRFVQHKTYFHARYRNYSSIPVSASDRVDGNPVPLLDARAIIARLRDAVFECV